MALVNEVVGYKVVEKYDGWNGNNDLEFFWRELTELVPFFDTANHVYEDWKPSYHKVAVYLVQVTGDSKKETVIAAKGSWPAVSWYKYNDNGQ